MSEKQKTDWESIEREFRAGQLSVREIARQHSITEGAIRKKSKAEGWQQDLTAKVRERVRTELVRSEVRKEHLKATTPEIIEAAALRGVEIIQHHRRDINQARGIVGTLMNQLGEVIGARPIIEEMIDQETDGDQSTRRKSALMKAVSIPTHASTVRDLSTAMKNLVALERQAFNLGGEGEDEPKGKYSITMSSEDVSL